METGGLKLQRSSHLFKLPFKYSDQTYWEITTLNMAKELKEPITLLIKASSHCFSLEYTCSLDVPIGEIQFLPYKDDKLYEYN